MKNSARVWTMAAVVLGFGVWAVVGISGAADVKPSPQAKDIDNLSKAIAKADADAVKEQTKAISEKYEDLDKVMHLFKTRAKKGLGVGKPKAVEPDGIELKLLDLGKKDVSKDKLAKEGDALEKMGYHIAAIASIARAKAPERDDGIKKVKDWNGWADDLKASALDLAKAAKARDAGGVDKAVSKLNASCANCHEKFRKNN